MIVGKHSALKGFGLFFYALITMLVLICTCNTSDFWGGVGIVNTIINTYVIITLYKHWSSNE